MNLLNDWHDLKMYNAKYNHSHFYTLFHGLNDRKDILEIFKGVDFEEDLFYRTNNYLEGQEIVDENVVLELVKNDINYKKEFLESIRENEVASMLTNLEFVFIDKESFMSRKGTAEVQMYLHESIGDYMITKQNRNPIFKHLYEAYYGLTSNYMLVWYLGKPSYLGDFNPDIFFEIWKSGGDYFVEKNQVSIFLKNNDNA